jgi:hypothetical protein
VEEALLLSASPQHLRVVRREHADTMEFRKIEGTWVNDSGAVVEIGAISSISEEAQIGEGVRAADLRLGYRLDRFGHRLAN